MPTHRESATSIGHQTTASGNFSIAMGENSTASELYSMGGSTITPEELVGNKGKLDAPGETDCKRIKVK